MERTSRFIFILVILASLIGGAWAESPSASILEEAGQLIAIEKLDDALNLLKSIETQTPATSAKINVLLGRIYLHLEKPAKAAEFFEQAIFSSLDDDAEAYVGLAEAQLQIGKLTQARQHARMAMLANPDAIGAHLVLASVEDKSGRVSEARQRLVDLLRDRPKSEPVVVAYAQFLTHRNDVKAATELLSGFLDRYPYAAEAGDLLGLLYWQQGQEADALQARANAARAFQVLGNDFRAKAILSWLMTKDSGGNYLEPLKPRTPRSVEKHSESPEVVEPLPAPVAPPQIVEGEQSGGLRPPAQPPKQLERPDPLPLPAGIRMTTGSGFIVGGGRLVVTNHHVVKKTGKIAVRSGTGEVREARVIKVAAEDDLAILELSEAFPEDYSIPFSQMIDANTGSAAVVLGFPMTNYFGWQQPSLTEGVVSKSSGLSDHPGTFLITSKINKGNSGGPVFDRYGRLIGVVVAKFDNTRFYEAQGYLPEDVNVAIKVSRVMALLNHLTDEDSTLPDRKVDLEELYQAMLARVVLVAAESK